MTRVDLKDCSRPFLEGMAKAIARTIDAGTTHNEEGYPLDKLLNEIFAQIPEATDYPVDQRSRRR